jgi:hypothetical protein
MYSPNRINLEDQADVMLWADNLAISVEQLHEVVAKVGPMVPSVRFYVKKSTQERKPSAPERAPRQNAIAGAVTPATVFPSMMT